MFIGLVTLVSYSNTIIKNIIVIMLCYRYYSFQDVLSQSKNIFAFHTSITLSSRLLSSLLNLNLFTKWLKYIFVNKLYKSTKFLINMRS